MAILASEGAREAVMRLVGMRCTINLTNSLLSTAAQEWDISNVPPIAEARNYLVALALYVEAFAKSRS